MANTGGGGGGVVRTAICHPQQTDKLVCRRWCVRGSKTTGIGLRLRTSREQQQNPLGKIRRCRDSTHSPLTDLALLSSSPLALALPWLFEPECTIIRFGQQYLLHKPAQSALSLYTSQYHALYLE
ncbi:unnamed protein product [Ectocarpus sp. 12 AP-2014]